MSYSELKAFDKDGKAFGLGEFRNSHYIPVIWYRLATKYGIIERLKKEEAKKSGLLEEPGSWTAREDRQLELSARGHLMMDMSPVWDLQNSPDIDEDDWWCLMFTFDYAVVPPKHIERLAQAFDNFDVGEAGVIDHGKGFALHMRKAAKEIEGIRGIALYSTSVMEDPWNRVPLQMEKCPECDGPVSEKNKWEVSCASCDAYFEKDYRPYNLDLDDKHWFIHTKEKWQNIKRKK